VTTTEQVEHYADPKVLQLGDWVFPNVHPYFRGLTVPTDAVTWTADRYVLLTRATQRPVLFKEVGLPSAGARDVSEERQTLYYRALSATNVRFAWFESFDQPWKTWAPIEPFWGIFRQDRTAKPVAQVACTNVR
jgi:exo-beta-1,3-glucanase (GH17 family)